MLFVLLPQYLANLILEFGLQFQLSIKRFNVFLCFIRTVDLSRTIVTDISRCLLSRISVKYYNHRPTSMNFCAASVSIHCYEERRDALGWCLVRHCYDYV